MKDVKLMQTYTLNSDDLWDKWSNFNEVEKFSPNIKESKIVSSTKKGIGTKRLCKLKNGGEIYEEIIDFSEREKFLTYSMTTEIMPFKAAYLSLEIYDLSDYESKAVMTLSFLPKFGFLGELIIKYIISPKLKHICEKLLLSSKSYFEKENSEVLNKSISVNLLPNYTGI